MPSMTRSYCKRTPVRKMGFSQRSSCKAQGLLKRSGKKNKGKYIKSPKYKRRRSRLSKQEIKCWKGYKRVSGKKPGSKGSCKKI